MGGIESAAETVSEGRKQMKQKKIIWGILCLFLICSVEEYVEFLFIRTDRTILAENVLCKLFAIVSNFAIPYVRNVNAYY